MSTFVKLKERPNAKEVKEVEMPVVEIDRRVNIEGNILRNISSIKILEFNIQDT